MTWDKAILIIQRSIKNFLLKKHKQKKKL